MLGTALLVQDAGTATGWAAVGAIGGVTVGVVVQWSQDRDVGVHDVVEFAVAGAGMLAALHATTVLGGWFTLGALALAACWWGLGRGEWRARDHLR